MTPTSLAQSVESFAHLTQSLTAGALGNAVASFEATITINDQIQQSSASNLSANDYVAILLAVA